MKYYEPALNRFLSDNGLSYPEFSDLITALKIFIVLRVTGLQKAGITLGNDQLLEWLNKNYSKVVDDNR